jgi:plasmid maintenance system killer protein
LGRYGIWLSRQAPCVARRPSQLLQRGITLLEKLRGDRAGTYSIGINLQWRICLRWTAAGPEDVEIVDYH